MRFTLVTDDYKVRINGDPRIVERNIGMPPLIHAVQWYDTYGEVEYKTDVNGNRPPNALITDFSPYQRFVEAHATAVTRDDLAKRNANSI